MQIKSIPIVYHERVFPGWLAEVGPYPYHRGKHVIATLNLYVAADESGIHDDARYCLVMGFLAGPRRWMSFEPEWARVLERFEVTDFHAKRFFARDDDGNRVDAYRGWSDEEAEGFLQSLLGVIDSHRLHPIGGAVETASFNALSYGERKYVTGGVYKNGRWLTSGAPSRPYYLAMLHLLIEAGHRTRAGITTNFMFDQQNVFESRATETFFEVKASATPDVANRLGHIMFADRVREPSLQAADLLVHCWYNHLTRGESIKDEHRIALDVLSKKRDGIRVWNAEGFKMTLSKLPEPDRTAVGATTDPNA